MPKQTITIGLYYSDFSASTLERNTSYFCFPLALVLLALLPFFLVFARLPLISRASQPGDKKISKAGIFSSNVSRFSAVATRFFRDFACNGGFIA